MHHRLGSDGLLVWFSARGEPALNPAFLSACGTDGLFLRDTNLDWYTSGVPGQTTSFAGTAAWIDRLVDEFGYVCVVLGGQSSGGYAALYVGALMRRRVSGIIAMAPQTRNIEAAGHRNPKVKLEEISHNYATVQMFPIHLHLNRSEASHRDEYFWNDWLQIDWLLERPHVIVTRYPWERHAVSRDLYEQSVLYRTICNDVALFRDYAIPAEHEKHQGKEPI